MITKRQLKKTVLTLENALNAKESLLNHYYRQYKLYKKSYNDISFNCKLKGVDESLQNYIIQLEKKIQKRVKNNGYI